MSDGPTAAGAVSSGLPSHPPPPASVDSGTPGMPAAAPRGAVLGPWLIPSLHKTPIILATWHNRLSHAPCISASGCHPHPFLFASDQVISFSAPRAASFQSLGHPILFDWLPHLDLHGHQATTVSTGPSIPGELAQPQPIFCRSSATGPSLLQPAQSSRPKGRATSS